MLARGDQAREMGHVDEEDRADLIADLAEASEVEVTRIGRTPAMISFGRCSFRETLDLVEVDEVIVLPDAVLDGVEPFARHARAALRG